MEKVFRKSLDWQNRAKILLKVKPHLFAQVSDIDTEPSQKPVFPDQKIPQKVEDVDYELTLITEDCSDSRYSFENTYSEHMTSENSMGMTQKNWQRKYELQRQQQKERFSKYLNESREDIFALDAELKDNFQYKLQYFQGGRTKEIEIKAYDVVKLNPPNYLNDTIINFYLKLLENFIIPDELRSQTYIFNTYFMDKLCPYDKVNMIPLNDQPKLAELFSRTYDQIKRWVKEDLFQFKYLLFPLNLPEHWSLIIVTNPQQIFTDGEASVLYLDSFGIMDLRLIAIVKMYLHKCHTERHDSDPVYESSPISKIPPLQMLVPRQINYVDCGVFMLEYAESFLMNPQYLLNNKRDFKLRMFPRVLINRKRYLIKKLVINIQKSNHNQAIQSYLQERNSIINQYANSLEEYDTIDDDEFQEYLSMKGNIADKHQALLDFYMNPNYNYYINEQITK